MRPRSSYVALLLAASLPAVVFAQPEVQVDDPLLAPAPPAPRQLTSWDEARSLLLQRSTDLRSAQAGVERAQGRWRQSLSALLPNARLSAGTGVDLLNPDAPALGSVGAGGAAAALTTSGTQATSPAVAAAATVSQSLVDVSAWRNVSSSAANTRSAEATLNDVRRRATQGLARTLVAVVAAERAAELNRLGLRQALERAALTRKSFQLGAATQLDVVRVQQDVAVARSALIAGDEQLRRTREALGVALGADTEVGVARTLSLDGMVKELRDECPTLPSADARDDVVAAREQVSSAQKSREAATAGYLPSLSLNSSAVALTTTPGPARVPTWSIAAVLSVPIWEGGLREGLVRERAGVQTQAEQAAEAARRNAVVDASRALRVEDTARALFDTAKEARDLAQRVDELTRRSFEIGKATSLDLVQSAVALRQAELNLALREFEWVQARLDAFLTVARCNP